MESNNSIEFINFSKRYAKSSFYAVKDVNLKVESGAIFGFLGPNGAGKSTCIKSMIGLQIPTSGDILICGKSVTSKSDEVKMIVGYVPDHYFLYEKLTGNQYIDYVASLYDVSAENKKIVKEKYTKMLELESAMDEQIKTYSHGMKQKITIIASLIHNPKVWILDEPLTGLDPQSVYQVKQCMINHAKEGNIVFFSSHIIDVVEKLCTEIAIIKNGQIIENDRLETLHTKHPEGLEKFYISAIKE